MTSIGTGYDLANSIFSPDGRNFQVEYAAKAVENAPTAIGIKCKDGVVLAVEKLTTSKLLKPSANKRIGTVDRHCGIAYAGLIPDGRHFVSRGRDEAASWRGTYKSPITVSVLANRLGSYVQAYTLYSGARPFGITAIVSGWDSEVETPLVSEQGHTPKSTSAGKVEGLKTGGPGLYMIEPSGSYWGYYGAATGKGRQVAKTELEKLDLPSGNLSLTDGIKHAARIIQIAHEDNKDKDYELEMSWVSSLDGPTRGRHASVPDDIVKQAVEDAKRELEAEE